MAHIHLITGGQRSGKSHFAEGLALQQSESPVYLATSQHWDKEYTKRIKRHQQRRTEQWQTIEETVDIARPELTGRTVLLDCITLWLTNLFEQEHYDQEKAIQRAKGLIDQLHLLDARFIIVTNEIGMGVIPMEASTRKFVDAHGIINQYIAKLASQVTLMVSGLPLTVK